MSENLTESLRSSSRDCKQQDLISGHSSPYNLITSQVSSFEPVRISVWMLRAAKWMGWLSGYLLVQRCCERKASVVWQGCNEAVFVVSLDDVLPLRILN